MPTLDWIGKQAVVGHHRRVPYRLLHCDRALSAGDPDAGNLLVQGDNLEALKALLPYYAGQVKCIYIDPPYNTGNEGWEYNDNVNSPEILRWLGQAVGKEAEDLSRHDKWLCMMYPRLALLKHFLRDDGIIFISIDDNELEHLRLVMDELFGRPNRVGTIVWKNATDNNPTRIVPEHEYVLCYAKNLSATPAIWKAQTLDVKQRLLDIGEQLIKEHDDDEELQAAYTKWYRENKVGLWPFQDYKFIDRGGVYTGMRSVHNPGKEGYRYDVIHPLTKQPCQEPMMGYRFPWETMKDLLDTDRILFGDDHTKLIELKVYARDYKAKLSSFFELDGRRGTNEIKAVFPESKRPFNFPKPTGLIEELLAFTTSGDDLILDSFAGSGTTGQAVLQLNAADSGRRRFLLVELDEVIGTNITRERLRRNIEGHAHKDGKNATEIEPLGSGFRFCHLGKPLFDEHGDIAEEVTFADLARHVFFTETGSPMPKEPRKNNPLLGAFEDRAIYLLFNGVLGDKRPDGGNVLTAAVLAELPEPPASAVDAAGGGRPTRVVYGEGCRLGAARLKREGVVFKQVPYEVRVS